MCTALREIVTGCNDAWNFVVGDGADYSISSTLFVVSSGMYIHVWAVYGFLRVCADAEKLENASNDI